MPRSEIFDSFSISYWYVNMYVLKWYHRYEVNSRQLTLEILNALKPQSAVIYLKIFTINNTDTYHSTYIPFYFTS